MANRKISEFTALTAPASGDTFAILDVDASGIEVNKKITYANVLGKAPDGSASAPAFSFSSDTNSGISGGSDTLVLSTGGTAAISVDSSQNVTLSANLTVSGTTTTIDTTTLTVKDKNIEIAKGNGNDAAVDGAGITIDSTDGDKTWNWVDSTDAWTSSEHIDLASGKVLKVAGTQVLSATNFTGTSAVATAVTVADESSDTSCNVLFTTAATGNLAPKSGTNLTFNSDTGALTANSFVGALTGNASGSSGSCTGNAATATEATNVTVSANNSTDETVFPVFVDGATGTQGVETDTGLNYNPSSGLLTATSFAGALTGNASGSSGSCTGNAATATALETARNIGGVSFDGTGNINLPGVNTSGSQNTSGTAAIATTVTVADESSDTSCNVLFATAATGNLAPKSGTNLTFNSSSGVLTATEFAGALTGNVTGNASGSSGSCTGNAATATKLAATKTIAGVAFDGSANISLNNNAITNGAGYITATLTEEQVQDFVGGMVTGNTETGITVTYQDSDGTLDFVVGTLNQDTTGSAATLTTSRNFSISGEATVSDTSFNGSADCDMSITIDDNVIDEANLKVSNSPTNGYFLSAQSGNTGGLTWAAVPTGIGGATGVDFNDGVKARFGTGNDLEIYHDSSGNLSTIYNSHANGLALRSNVLMLQNSTGDHDYLTTANEAGVSLYYDNTKRFETYSSGVKTYGGFLRIVGDEGGTAELDLYADEGDDAYDIWQVKAGGSSDFSIAGYNGSSYETAIKAVGNGAVEIYYDGGLQCYTFSTGLKFNDDKQIRMGSDDDMRMYHDNNQGIINNATGPLKIRSNDLQLAKTDNEVYLKGISDGAVELYYDNSKKLHSYSGGVSVFGNFNLEDSDQIRLGDSSDLLIYHDSGGDSYIQDKGSGHLYITVDDLIIQNNDTSETIAKFNENGNCEFRYDDSIKAVTTSTGIAITGTLSTTGTGGNITTPFTFKDESSNLIANFGGATAEFYYDGTKKFETHADGLHIGDGGNLDMPSDSSKIVMGASDDLEIFHNGVSSYVSDVGGGNLKLTSNGTAVQIETSGDANMAIFRVDSSVDLYFDNNKKFETEAGGGKIYGSLTETSDRALKKDIQPLSNSLTNLKQLNGYSFAWKDNNIKSLGLIAQEVETIYPDLVTGEEGDKGLKYSGLIAPLLEAVKELSAKVETLETKVAG